MEGEKGEIKRKREVMGRGMELEHGERERRDKMQKKGEREDH